MAILVGSQVKGGSEFEPASPGVHPFVLAEVALLEMEQHPKFGPRQQVIFVYQIAETTEVEFDGKREVRRKEVRDYVNVLSGLGQVKSRRGGTRLRKLLEGWRGRKFTEEELMKFGPKEEGGGGEVLDLESLVGKPGQLVVEISESKQGRSFAKLLSLLPPKKGEQITLDDGFKYVPLAERRGGDDDETQGGGESAAPPEDDDDAPWDIGL
jgi:hypothetical protein